MKNITLILLFALLCFLHKTHAQTVFLGMTSAGGDGFGTVFKTDSSGANLEVLSTFAPNAAGASPIYSHMVKANNGKLYGMTREGGVLNKGVIFEYDNNHNLYVKKFDFGGLNGAYPEGSLMLASNGKFYGMTTSEGSNGMGVLFEYDYVNHLFTVLYNFDGTNGAYPRGYLFQAANGNLYGMTTYGGLNDKGVLFEFNYLNSVFSKKYDFNLNNGEYPYASLVEGNNGNLLGMTVYGGLHYKGVIFEYDFRNNIYLKKHDIEGGLEGANPYGSLVRANNGKFYGLTDKGGATGKGVLFEYNQNSNTYTVKFNFNNSMFNPYGTLMKARNGKLYGATLNALFEYDTESNVLVNKFVFTGSMGVFPNGYFLRGTFVQSNNGKLYGLTNNGGASGKGVIFEYDYVNDVFSKKVDFSTTFSGNAPYASLMQASNGKCYGTTYYGGTLSKGIIFEYDPATNRFTKKIDMGNNMGAGPRANLLEMPNGKLYGTTTYGGINDSGVIFEYDISANSYTKKFDFFGLNGKNPEGDLVLADNGKCYGLTNLGGYNLSGIIFEYDYISNTCNRVFDFIDTIGINPIGSMIKASNGKLYGISSLGGANNHGVLFEFDPNTYSYNKLYDFNVINGSSPKGKLVQAPNGKLYGLCTVGGVNNFGVIFEFDLSNNSYNKLYDFNQTDGKNPYGSLMLASNGRLYGMTNLGAANNLGSLFEFDLINNSFLKKQDFSNATGGKPIYSHLIEIIAPNINKLQSIESAMAITAFPNPTTGAITLQLGQTYSHIEVRVSNVLGQILSRQAFNNTEQINLELHGDRGLYLLEIKTNTGQVATMKVMKE